MSGNILNQHGEPLGNHSAIKASVFQHETLTILLTIEELLAPNGYHDKKGVGEVATRPPWITKETIREVGQAVKAERHMYRNKILKWVVNQQLQAEGRLQINHNALVYENGKFFKDHKIIRNLEKEVAADKAILDTLQKIQSLLNN
jgi:hypothetical protein